MSDELGVTRQTNTAPRERIARWFFFACASVSVVVTLGIIGVLLLGAVEFFRATAVPLGSAPEQTVQFTEYLLGTTWS
ncbi:phosphate ABC transporter permease subunit PstC, partial [Halocatena pleomorpha]